jgi:hypothetical protein
MPFPADKIINRQTDGREPASDAEEHSPVMFIQINIELFAATHIIASARFRYCEILPFSYILIICNYSIFIIYKKNKGSD